MEGYVRIIKALDFAVDHVDDDLNYKIENSDVLKCVPEYKWVDGNCKCWLKSISQCFQG